jgi:hypothetical protein
LKRCSTMWAVEFAASRLQVVRGATSVCVLSILANGLLLMITAEFDQ